MLTLIPQQAGQPPAGILPIHLHWHPQRPHLTIFPSHINNRNPQAYRSKTFSEGWSFPGFVDRSIGVTP